MTKLAARGPIALLTPMANPTVEREMRELLPLGLDYVVGRLTGTEADSTARLIEYAERLPSFLGQFGGMDLSAVAFACTASSYLVGAEGEARIAAAMPVPVLWGAGTIRAELARLGAQRIAVLSPYPEAIHAAGLGYWRAAGIDVVAHRRVEIGSADTRAIYALAQDDAAGKLAELRALPVDAVLLSGTGMPTLGLIDPDGSPPVISSNHCLAEAMIKLGDAA